MVTFQPRKDRSDWASTNFFFNARGGIESLRYSSAIPVFFEITSKISGDNECSTGNPATPAKASPMAKLPESIEEVRIGDGHTFGLQDLRFPFGHERGHRKSHGDPMITLGLDARSVEFLRSLDRKAVFEKRDFGAHCAKSLSN